jgi:Protein of unknown function (DUF3040)
MELSEHERRQLQEMESHLLAEDPSLASSLRVHRLRVGVGAKVVLAVCGLLIGVLLMAVGVWRAHVTGIAVALVGYLVLLASTTLAVDCLQSRAERSALGAKSARRARRAT